MPKVSVVIPAYNAEPYIEDAVNSICNQSFSDIEIIAIDDGSSDGTLRILRGLAEQDRRIKLISRENRGIVATPNEGIDVASGEWVAMMDADDISSPQRIAKQLEYAQSLGLDAVGSSMNTFGDRSGYWPYPVDQASICHQLFIWKNPFANPTMLIRAELLAEHRYEERFAYAQDLGLWFRLCLLPGIKMGNHPEALLSYRRHATQNSSSKRDLMIQRCAMIMREGLAELGVGCTEREFELHCQRRLTKKYETVADLEAYGVFLERLYVALSDRFGHSEEMFHYWLRTVRKNRKFASDAKLPPAKALGGRWRGRIKYFASGL